MDFRIAIDIAAPAEIVWSVIADGERWHEWTPSVTSIKLLGEGPLRVGMRAIVRQPKFPPALWTVIELEPGRRFTWRSGAPLMWVYAFHSATPIDGGTRAELGLHFEGVLGRLLGRMTSSINNRYLGMEANGLKRRSEELARQATKRAP